MQGFNPTNETVSVAVSDHQAIAEQLVADCISELKNQGPATPRKPKKDLASEEAKRAFAQNLMEELRWQSKLKIKLKELTAGAKLLKSALETQKAAVLVAMKGFINSESFNHLIYRVNEQTLQTLLRKKLRYDDSEIEAILTLLEKNSVIHTSLPVTSILTNVERHVDMNGLSDPIRKQLNRLTKHYHSGSTYSDTRKAGERISKLLQRPEQTESNATNSQIIKMAENIKAESMSFDLDTGEAWAIALLVELGKLSDEARTNWARFLEHCGTAKSSKPAKKFLKQSKEMLNLIGEAEFVCVVAPALLAIGKPGESQRFNFGGRIEYGEPTQIHDTHVDRLRGLVWTTSLVNDESLINAVGDAAEKCFQKVREVGPRSPKIGNACLIAMSSSACENAVAQLGRLKSRGKHVSTKKQIAKAFAQAAANAGMTEEDLAELSVPQFGMTEVGIYAESFGHFTAEVKVHANRKPDLVWRRENGWTQKSVPAAVKQTDSDQIRALKKKLKEIQKLMPSVRQRIEQLFLNERKWAMVDFRKRFLDHPVVGVIARHLIWDIEQKKESISVKWHGGKFVTSSGKAVKVSDTSKVSIWHPMHCSAEEVFSWRTWLVTNQVTQSFKQAHREVYILTEAERATVDHSNRFASHIIRQHQFSALCQQRGWQFDLQGEWDSWNAPCLDLPQHEIRVEFLVDPMEGKNEISEAHVYSFLATEYVRFYPLRDGQVDMANAIALKDVSPLVFSEVMRDVDLFVGVTSIGNDPDWQERDADSMHANYCERFSYGELSQTATTRKQTLETIIPKLAIGKQCRIDSKFLIVEGSLRTYKIHLGSGNILMSPDDRYLCIVQKRGSGNKQTGSLYLPFEGDNTLALILSKAFLLANDDKIKDHSIVNQIRIDRNNQ